MNLSIVIALYNTEKYIEKCIRSVVDDNKCDGYEIEVIVVNDGSTDNGRAIVENLMKAHSCIKLVNKENGGQSTARNIAFKMATGDYIFCLDSDDSIEPGTLKPMLDAVYRDNLDMASFYYKWVAEDGTVLSSRKTIYEDCGVITGAEFINRFTVVGAMWLYFYKTELFRTHNLSLIEGIFHEDEEFVIKIISYAKRIRFVPIEFYVYLQRHNSTINQKSISHKLKLMYDVIRVVEGLNERLSEVDKNSDWLIHKGITKKREQLLVSMAIRLLRQNFSYEQKQQLLHTLKEKNLYPFKIKVSNWKFKLFALLLNRKILFSQFMKLKVSR